MDPSLSALKSRLVNIAQWVKSYRSPAFEILSTAHRDEILQHLLDLGTFDRKLRFCGALPDSAIASYVEQIDFRRDLMLGYREEGRLVALVHLGATRKPGETELGISVADACRGRGLGVRLTREAFKLARQRGFTRVHVYFLNENLPMRAIVRHYPARVHREGGDNEVCIALESAA